MGRTPQRGGMDRRQFLAGAAAVIVTATAGCGGPGDDDGISYDIEEPPNQPVAPQSGPGGSP